MTTLRLLQGKNEKYGLKKCQSGVKKIKKNKTSSNEEFINEMH